VGGRVNDCQQDRLAADWAAARKAIMLAA
jgi:hypothetical protein